MKLRLVGIGSKNEYDPPVLLAGIPYCGHSSRKCPVGWEMSLNGVPPATRGKTLRELLQATTRAPVQLVAEEPLRSRTRRGEFVLTLTGQHLQLDCRVDSLVADSISVKSNASSH